MVKVLRNIAKTFHVNPLTILIFIQFLLHIHKFQGLSVINRRRYESALKAEIESGGIPSDVRKVLKLPHKIRVMSAYEAASIVAPLRPVFERLCRQVINYSMQIFIILFILQFPGEYSDIFIDGFWDFCQAFRFVLVPIHLITKMVNLIFKTIYFY